MSKPQASGLELRVLFVSTAGRRVVRVEPKDGILTIEGQGSWKVDHNRIFPGKGPFDCICVQGQGEALSLWEQTPLTATEVDGIANDNLLRQIKELAQGGQQNKINWMQVGVSFLLFIAIVGVGFKVNGDIEDLSKDLHAAHPLLDQGQAQGDTIRVQGNQGGQTQGGAAG